MVGMRKDPKVGGGVSGTCEVAKNQTQHSPSFTIYTLECRAPDVEATSTSATPVSLEKLRTH
ncbi:hypothetical protein Lal_00041624 [Lupinus albus]|nr:hypothetical protein Lal_00041624 [Lupinus albus]